MIKFQKIFFVFLLLGAFDYAYATATADVCVSGSGSADGRWIYTGELNAHPYYTKGGRYLDYPNNGIGWYMGETVLGAGAVTWYYTLAVTDDPTTAVDWLISTGANPAPTDGNVVFCPPPLSPPDLTTGSATSSVEQIQQNLFHGWVVFFATMFGIVWFFRRQKQ